MPAVRRVEPRDLTPTVLDVTINHQATSEPKGTKKWVNTCGNWPEQFRDTNVTVWESLTKRPVKRDEDRNVYQLVNDTYPRSVAVKCFPKAGKLVGKREFDLLSSLQGHRSIIRLRDQFGIADHKCFFIMEFADGTIESRMNELEGPAPKEEVLWTTKTMLNVLKFLRKKELVHRDIKPSNIALVGPRRTPKLMDFGIATALPKSDSITEHSAGTYGWMCPEQALGRSVTSTTDLFACGMVTMYMASGIKHRLEIKNGITEGQASKIFEKFIKDGVESLPETESPELKNFLENAVLRFIAEDRIGLPDILEHAWIHQRLSQGKVLRPAAEKRKAAVEEPGPSRPKNRRKGPARS